ncbi:MAG: ribokinase [Alphaproteobacteria bacterium]|nr:ribokinase [Alphaproteobacteria bacterium]
MIVVFGSLNMDLIVAVPALPRAGQTVLAPTYRTAAGGKGANQAVAAARAGAQVRMAGRIGRDAYGDALLECLAADGVDATAVKECDQPTGLALIAVDGAGENQIVVASGANLAAGAAQVPDAWLGPETILVLQLEVPYAENWDLARRARRAGARVVLNAAPAGPVPIDVFDVLIVNQIEAIQVARHAGLDDRRAPAAARSLSHMSGKTVVVTIGAKGAIACAPDGSWSIGVLPITPVDTTGAGDAFVGAFAAALDAGGDLGSALRRGSVAGGLACLTPGAQPSLPTAAAIAARLGELPAACRRRR